MKKFAFICTLSLLLITACGKKDDDDSQATPVNIEKGAAPEMWNSEIDLTPIESSIPLQEEIMEEQETEVGAENRQEQAADTQEPEKTTGLEGE